MKNEIIEKALTKKGQFAHLEWKRPCKTLKSCNSIIEKRTVANNIRIGCGYDNLRATIDGRANGTLPQENQGLRGFEWIQYPITLKAIKNGKDYIRVETAKNTTFNTTYFIDGKETTKKDIENYLYSTEKKNGEMPPVMNICVENIEIMK